MVTVQKVSHESMYTPNSEKHQEPDRVGMILRLHPHFDIWTGWFLSRMPSFFDRLLRYITALTAQ